ncbi:oxygen-independent coproporphyrinogen III oxidase [Pseudomonas sp. F1_0610]|uniref:oxygen-independent coproporphyrinogen III oxidase n=1 Tax=Pseudomonas sp. F1_0610 TaxID=3114284 RepID=UPI0039C41E89
MPVIPAFDRALVEKYDRPGPRYTSYPTAPQFHTAFAVTNYEQAIARSNSEQPATPLSIYIHIPFCQSLCYYCACNKIITHKTERAAQYLEYLKKEIVLQAALFDKKRVVTQLHLGGGTPTYLTNEQLKALMESLQQAFTLDSSEKRQFSLEVDPRTITPVQLKELYALGFNRLSFGVQDFDADVQQAVNRVQSQEQVVALMQAAREVDFKSISVDLIYGLPLQTVTSFDETLRKIIALKPDRIAAYSYAHLPQLVKAQRMIKPEDMPPPERKLELLELTIQRLSEAGYIYIGMDHFAHPDDELAIAQQEGTLQRNFQGYSTHADCDLIGLGVSSIGKVNDTYNQNVKELSQYYALLDEEKLPLLRGYQLNNDDILRRDVISSLMCHNHIDIPAIEARYNIDFNSYFADAISALAEHVSDNLVEITPQRITLLPKGNLMMRTAAMAFDAYLGKDQRGNFSRTV